MSVAEEVYMDVRTGLTRPCGDTRPGSHEYRIAAPAEPESGTHKVAPVAEAKKVHRADLETAQGRSLDALAVGLGLFRIGDDGVYTHALPQPTCETDVALRNRALAYAEEWGLLEDEGGADGHPGGFPVGYAIESASQGSVVAVSVGGRGDTVQRFKAARRLDAGALVTVDDLDMISAADHDDRVDAVRYWYEDRGLKRAAPAQSVLSIHAGGFERLGVREDGAVAVNRTVMLHDERLPRMLRDIGGTPFDLKTRREGNAMIVDGADAICGIWLDDGGEMRGLNSKGDKSEELLTPKDAAEQLKAIVEELYTEMRAEKLGRAIFETDYDIGKFVRSVSDDFVVLETDNGRLSKAGFDMSRQTHAFQKAWDRDENGWRTVSLVRARQILRRLGDT